MSERGSELALEGLVVAVEDIFVESPPRDPALDIIARLAPTTPGDGGESASAMIARMLREDPYLDYSDLTVALGISATDFWPELSRHHERHTLVREDGVRMVRGLADAGLHLYAVSRGPLGAALATLSRAGLGGPEGAPCFREVVGANLAGPLGRSPEGLWKFFIASTGLGPERLALVAGDSAAVADALRAGFRHCFVVDHNGATETVSTGATTRVRSADAIVSLVRRFQAV